MKLIWRVVIIVGGASLVSLPVVIPVLGFQYMFWKMNIILDSVPEGELIGRTKDSPEVKIYLAKYDNSTVYIDRDFYIGIDYAITECSFGGENCSVVRPLLAHKRQDQSRFRIS